MVYLRFSVNATKNYVFWRMFSIYNIFLFSILYIYISYLIVCITRFFGACIQYTTDIIYYLLLYIVWISNSSTASHSDDGGPGDRHSVLNFVPQCFLPIFTLSNIHFYLLAFFSLSSIILGVPVGGYLEKHSCTSSLSLKRRGTL